MTKLEFEADKTRNIGQYISINIKRKGLEIGTLLLKKEQYKQLLQIPKYLIKIEVNTNDKTRIQPI